MALGRKGCERCAARFRHVARRRRDGQKERQERSRLSDVLLYAPEWVLGRYVQGNVRKLIVRFWGVCRRASVRLWLLRNEA